MSKSIIFITILTLITGEIFSQESTTNPPSGHNKTIVSGISIDQPGIVEYAPSISADGNTMIFQSNREGSYKLYQAKLDNNETWTAIKSIDNINNFGDTTDLRGGPSISFDGNTLYFFASFNGGYGREDIYYSIREGEDWGEPQNIGGMINDSGYQGFPSISADGQTLYFVGDNREGPADKELGKLAVFCLSIFKSNKDQEGNWTAPEKLPFPINMECEKAPRIMADNKTLIFSSNRLGGLGNLGTYDLYQSQLSVIGEWSFPIPLSYVNTNESDQFSTISASGDLMYFVYDSKDIYSVEIPEHLRQFINNVVQGNITDEDTKRGIAAEIIVTDALTSDVIMTILNNPSDGGYALVLSAGRSYNLEVRKDGYSSYTTSYDLLNVQNYQEFKDDIQLFNTARLSVNVSDLELFESVNADITLVELGSNNVISKVKSDPKDGRAELSVPLGHTYSISISAENFSTESFNFDVTGLVMYRDYEEDVTLTADKIQMMINVADLKNNAKVRSRVLIRNKSRDEVIEVEGNQMVSLRVGDRYVVEVTSDEGYAFNSTEINLSDPDATIALSVDLKLQKLEVDALLSLKEINFESNSFKLSEGSFIELRRVIKLMKENPKLAVEIAAHTDDVGSAAYNKNLSDKRSNSIVEFLVENNIVSNRFVARGYGESQPLLANDSEENRAKNRRVELKILSVN